MTFSLNVYKPLTPGNLTPVPITYTSLDPDVTTMSWTTENPGGFGTLDLGMQRLVAPGGVEYGSLPQALDIPPFAHVEITWGSHLCYAGRVMSMDRNDAGLVSGFQAKGYGLTAVSDLFIVSYQTSPKSSGAILREVLADAAPLLVVGPDFVDPGVVHYKGEFNALFPADVINTIIREGGPSLPASVTNAGGAGGDVSSGAWDFLVYEGNVIQFHPRLPPAGPPSDPPDFLVPFDHRVQWHEDYTRMVGQVSVRYQDTYGTGATVLTSPIVNPSFQSTWGFMRGAVIEGGKMRAVAAAAFAQTYLAERTSPAVGAKVTRRYGQGTEIAGGIDIWPWMVRAGQWIGIGDQPYLCITHTEYDAISELLHIEAGDSLPSGSHMIRNLNRIAAHVVAGTSPVTGARA